MTTQAVPVPLLVLTFDQPQKWPSANDRYGHWAPRARVTADWRRLGCQTARRAWKGAPPIAVPVRVEVTFHRPDRRRYDVGNLALTSKATIDGLVDAGVLVDDDSAHVIGPDLRAGETGPRRFVVRLYPAGWRDE